MRQYASVISQEGTSDIILNIHRRFSAILRANAAIRENLHGLAVGVQQSQLVKVVKLEAKCSFSVSTLICEVLEDLLERSLADSILRYLHLLLPLLNQAKHEANIFVLARHAQLEEVTTLLQKVNPLEFLHQQAFDEVEGVLLD